MLQKRNADPHQFSPEFAVESDFLAISFQASRRKNHTIDGSFEVLRLGLAGHGFESR